VAESKVSDSASDFALLKSAFYHEVINFFLNVSANGVNHASAMLMNILPEHTHVALL
jgi:hypothetical protein